MPYLPTLAHSGNSCALVQVAWPVIAPRLNIPGKYRNRPSQPGLGASGAVNAVVALSILAAPSRTVLLYFFVPIPSAALGCLFLGEPLNSVPVWNRLWLCEDRIQVFLRCRRIFHYRWQAAHPRSHALTCVGVYRQGPCRALLRGYGPRQRRAPRRGLLGRRVLVLPPSPPLPLLDVGPRFTPLRRLRFMSGPAAILCEMGNEA